MWNFCFKNQIMCCGQRVCMHIPKSNVARFYFNSLFDIFFFLCVILETFFSTLGLWFFHRGWNAEKALSPWVERGAGIVYGGVHQKRNSRNIVWCNQDRWRHSVTVENRREQKSMQFTCYPSHFIDLTYPPKKMQLFYLLREKKKKKNGERRNTKLGITTLCN